VIFVDLSKQDVFEYMENLYTELNERDNGYYPSNHDDFVRKSAVEKFGLPAEEIANIYDKYTKQVAKLKAIKMGRMSKKQILREMEAIVNENKEFPVKADNPESLPKIKPHLDELFESYFGLAEKIGQNGWTIPMIMGFSDLDILAQSNQEKEDFNNYFCDFYFRRKNTNFKLMIKHIGTALPGDSTKKLFAQCVENFMMENYLITVNSLVSVLEGVLASCESNKNNIWMMKVCKDQLEKVKNDKKQIRQIVWTSFANFIILLYTKSDFATEEPSDINRHWLLHGRTSTDWGKEDCLRLFNAIYTIISLLKFEGR
jgi:hypothetical protein